MSNAPPRRHDRTAICGYDAGPMSPRIKKLIGAVVLLIFVAVYALGVMALAQPLLKDAGPLTSLAFYAVAGLLWIVPVMPLIAWMERK